MKLNLSPMTLLYFAFCLLISHKLTVIAMTSAILVHELTHLVFLWCFAGKAKSLTVTPMGLSIGRIGMISHWREVWLSLSAPIINLLLALLYARIGLHSSVVGANLGIALINLLPIYPLDGGKALSALLSIAFDQRSSQRIIFCTSLIFMILFWLFAVAVALVMNEGLSLLFFACGLLFSLDDFSKTHK